ncbi:hypothetical protein KJ359_004510 [Pestalotiopsis sp. 9143b]|nr:hypothetical protein KJ359_004510 [Pestalotiopsis sp. 9143b]
MAFNDTNITDPKWADGGLRDLIGAVQERLLASKATTLLGVVLLWFWVLSFFQAKRPRVPGAQMHGSRGFWEPSFFLQLRFIWDAFGIISSGYEKFKDVPFVVSRLDTDINVMPMKYLDELRLVPRNQLNGKMNLFRSWPWASAIRDSDLHVHVLSRKLNPDLPRYVQLAYDEFEYGWDKDVPQPEEWTKVDIQNSMRMLVARMSAKAFVGEPTCRDPVWLGLTLNFSMDLFLAGFALRMFPPWSHWFVTYLIPARRRVQKQIDIGTKVVRELMEERGEAAESDDDGTLFEWMAKNATGTEGTLQEMAARQCILTLASIHTTATTVANALFDLIGHPEWIDVLREEIDETIKTHGDLSKDVSVKTWLQHLEKMDSFIVESQRLNPPILLTPQRIAMIPITLKDGTHIPVGTRIAWPGPQHAFDPNVTASPKAFDPMRSYNKRYAGSGENLNKFQCGQTDPDNMSFGYGNQVCPGRYFAVCEIKLVFMRLIQNFDFASANNGVRPRTIYADENVILDPYAKVMMRKRAVN